MIKNFLKKFGFAALTTLVVVLSLTSFYFYKKANTSDPAVATQKAVDSVVKKVSKLIVLPQNETPTLATVSNLEPLKGQIFFADAQIGDKVLMYAQAKKAVLYNPELDRVVNIAPIDTTPTQTIQTNLEPTSKAVTTNKKKK